PDPDTDAGIDPDADADADADAGIDPDADAGIVADADADAGIDPDADAGIDPDADADVGAASDRFSSLMMMESPRRATCAMHALPSTTSAVGAPLVSRSGQSPARLLPRTSSSICAVLTGADKSG
ncbi:MAG TPA: hypothetical protein PKU97_12770, partial [Kofleriaceae bacterium]|nr:hypothetical protein [Kofleriaceae bacterium]